MDKQAKIQDIFKRAEEAAKAKKLQETKIEVVEDTTDESPSHSLPVEYVTASGIMVNSKDIMTNTSFLNKLNLNNNAYDDLKFTKEQALKIQTEMARMTAGVISVTPLTCLGPDCMFAKTCIAQGTEILTYSSKNGYKKIEDIVEGDIIYSFNKYTKKIEHDYVEKLSYMGVKETYRITTHTGLTLKCTADHPILTSINDKLIYQSIDQGLGEGSQVYISDTDGMMDDLIDSYGDLLIDVIEDVEYLGKDEVYDITVRNNHNFFANNINVHNCPLQQEKRAPIGKDCWLEVNQIKYWMEKYIEEFQVDGSSLTDLHMISRLCEYDVLEMRATKYLKEHDQALLTDFISSYDEAGNPISNKALSPAFELKERIDRMRSKTLKELMATREAKAKLIDAAKVSNASNNLSALKEQLEQLIKNKAQIIDVTPAKD